MATVQMNKVARRTPSWVPKRRTQTTTMATHATAISRRPRSRMARTNRGKTSQWSSIDALACAKKPTKKAAARAIPRARFLGKRKKPSPAHPTAAKMTANGGSGGSTSTGSTTSTCFLTLTSFFVLCICGDGSAAMREERGDV
uniref:Uncharacterized protein n=1 Tax=Oryza nivara TaxID=4536 RepID=A0A0E0FX75_ORYNI